MSNANVWLGLLQQLPMSMSYHAVAAHLTSDSLYDYTLQNRTLLEELGGNYDVIQNGMMNVTSLSPNWRHPALAILMGTLCLTTITGNCLVVLAVCTKKYLRNPTGYLIVSLALADLIVGLVVMPLNSLFEMTRHMWLLGLTMCDLFHALDILASTSSIWNLCVISLDRYMAGQDPIGYRDKVSTRRITIAIVFVWVISACLSFPAIIWWRKSSPHLYKDQSKCLFTDDWVYVIFSSLVSFYIPLILILFAYGRVFLIATRHSRSLKSGMKKVKCKQNKKLDSETVISGDNVPTLRIHFGRNNLTNNRTSGGVVNPLSNVQMPTNGQCTTRLHDSMRATRSPPINRDSPVCYRQPSCKSLASQTTESQGNCSPLSKCNSNCLLLHPDTGSSVNTYGVSRNSRVFKFDKINRTPSMMTVISNNNTGDDHQQQPQTIPLAKKKLGVREKSRQMMKYVHEQRAARTLSIVVGAFILCWMPFFIFSPLIAMCRTCIANQEQVFSFITWAGHLNSMLNPLIYSRFSRDFRRAFKQILTCQQERPVKKAIKTPLNIVFAQLVSITQFPTEPQHHSECLTSTGASVAE